MSTTDPYADRQRYRALHAAADLRYFRVRLAETDLHIGALTPLPDAALAAVKDGRSQVEAAIALRPAFLTSLSPLPSLGGETPLVAAMLEAGRLAKVGPMASVAGALAEYTGRALLADNSQVIVENGGDLFLAGPGQRTVSVWAGNSPLSGRLGVVVEPGPGLGVCTSSATVGHSLSLGRADAALIIATSATLADACATALGNRISSATDLQPALAQILAIPGVQGALAIVDGQLGVLGQVQLTMI